ncbi:MAG: hypothetical protein QOF58_4443, partial [Pseudonocardiales bacterium]|nr:hypothetical protein [Pseudonocardiales bacterium]
MRETVDQSFRVARSRRRALARALAAVLAWEAARRVLHSPQPFFAPLAALVTVHVTVYGSVRSGIQRVLAVIAGVLLSFAVAQVLGVNGVSLGLVLVIALVVG